MERSKHGLEATGEWHEFKKMLMTLHSIFTGHSSIKGGRTSATGMAVSPKASNLLTWSLPEIMPQPSTLLRILTVGKLITNSFDVEIRPWE